MKGPPGGRIYLLRHGETANAHEVCLNGHFDVALSAKGRDQFRILAESLKDKPIRAVYSSDLKRTRDGARLIAEQHNLEPIEYPELRELSFGHWEGMSLKELSEKYPGELELRTKNTAAFRADGGENFQELQDRVLPKYRQIIERHPDDTIVLVCHGGVNRTILADTLGFPIANLFRISQEYAAVNIIQHYRDQIVVEHINGTYRDIP